MSRALKVPVKVKGLPPLSELMHNYLHTLLTVLQRQYHYILKTAKYAVLKHAVVAGHRGSCMAKLHSSYLFKCSVGKKKIKN